MTTVYQEIFRFIRLRDNAPNLKMHLKRHNRIQELVKKYLPNGEEDGFEASTFFDISSTHEKMIFNVCVTENNVSHKTKIILLLEPHSIGANCNYFESKYGHEEFILRIEGTDTDPYDISEIFKDILDTNIEENEND